MGEESSGVECKKERDGGGKLRGCA